VLRSDDITHDLTHADALPVAFVDGEDPSIRSYLDVPGVTGSGEVLAS
jgi:hypothetical protein